MGAKRLSGSKDSGAIGGINETGGIVIEVPLPQPVTLLGVHGGGRRGCEELAERAALSVHDKDAADAKLERFFPVIIREATDERNFVKKAVNWALRNIGKRNRALNRKAVAAAKKIQRIDSRAARWVASDALRELTSEKVRARLA